MKYLLIQLITLFITVTLMYYISKLDYFLPHNIEGEPNWYNISYILFLIFMILQSFISTVIFLFQKFTIYGRSEFPAKGFSLKWGLLLAAIFVAALLLNILHILNLGWGIAILIIIVIIAIFVR